MEALESLVRSQSRVREASYVEYNSVLENVENTGAPVDLAATTQNSVPSAFTPNQNANFRDQGTFDQCVNARGGAADCSITEPVNYNPYSCAELGGPFVLPYLLSASEARDPSSSQQVVTKPYSSTVLITEPAATDMGVELPNSSLDNTLTLSRNLVDEIRNRGVVLDDVLRLGLQYLEQGQRSNTDGSMEPLDASLMYQATQCEFDCKLPFAIVVFCLTRNT